MPSLQILARMVATRCCVCGAALTDAESLEHAIGPVCSKRYYNPVHVPTETQVMETLGLLAISDLPEHLIDAFLSLVNNNYTNARKASNLLVYWASAHYADRSEVFKCCALIRSLGYQELADKLEVDRTEAMILDKGDHLEAFIPDKGKIRRDMGYIKGAEHLINEEIGLSGNVTTTRIKRGHKVGWRIPKSEEEHFMCVLGINMPRALVCGTKGIYEIKPCHWTNLLQFRRTPVAPKPQVPSQLSLGLLRIVLAQDPVFVSEDTAEGKLRVVTPYNDSFIAKLKLLVPYKHRAWNPSGRYWEVSVGYLNVVLTLIEENYGVVTSQSSATTP